jgi:CBS domain-containing protein
VSAPHIVARLPAGDSRLDTPVRDIMRAGVITVPDDSSLLQAQRAMVSHGVHAVLVVGARQGRPLGWVTARGMLGWLNHDPGLTRAAMAVTEPAATIEPTATAADAVRCLAKTGASHLVVARHPDQPPQGVISELDIVRLVAG